MEKANVNKKQRITKSKEEKNILVINNQKSNYKVLSFYLLHARPCKI